MRAGSGTSTDTRETRGRAEPNRGLRSGDEHGVHGSELCASMGSDFPINHTNNLPVSMNAVVHDTGHLAMDILPRECTIRSKCKHSPVDWHATSSRTLVRL